MRLLGNTIHIAPLKKTLKSIGGILLPEAYQDDEKQYVVLSVGQGRKLKNGTRVPIEVEPGDRVLVDCDYGSVTLPDGTKIVGAPQILAKWKYAPI